LVRTFRFLQKVRRISAVCAALAGLLTPQAARAADPWLFVNDVHFDPLSRNPRPIKFGRDTNEALLVSALAEMRRVAPNPPVIVMAGDFLAHHFKNALAASTMADLARRFNRSFPHAQFVIALGNEDSACGDYGVTPNSSFLRTVAAAWEPLVNRNGAAPDFTRTFSRDGFYAAKLPVAGLRAVVVDDAFWSAFYRNACGHGDPSPASFAELAAALGTAGTEHRWLVMHIPPGIDAQSTVSRAHRLAIVPFMRPDPRNELLGLIADPARRVDLVVAAHIHRFAFRIVDAKAVPPARAGRVVPILVSPAISPIYWNSPSFLSADVAADGTIRNLEEHSSIDRVWHAVGDLASLGVGEFSGPALASLQARLERDEPLREKFFTLYAGGSPFREIDTKNAKSWKPYWCAAVDFASTDFRDCIEEGGFSFLTRRGLFVVGAAIAGSLLIAGAVVALVIARVRAARRRGTNHS
jgi:sphingomyelin phosphodiesterase acid-like 3